MQTPDATSTATTRGSAAQRAEMISGKSQRLCFSGENFKTAEDGGVISRIPRYRRRRSYLALANVFQMSHVLGIPLIPVVHSQCDISRGSTTS